MGKLDGKVALVTGSSRGIGKAIAIGLAREGARLILASRNSADLKKTEKSIMDLGGIAEAIPTDLAFEDQIDALFKRILDHFGRLDILVNNAGVFDSGPIDEMSTEKWDHVVAVNLRAPFLCTRAAFRIMKSQGGGRIINIGSISAQRVRPDNAAYSSTKFGLVGLTHTTALEGRRYGISCGCLHPGNTRHDYPGSPEWEKEPKMSQEETAATAVYMACQPPHVNILEIVQLPNDQFYVGRG